MSLRMHQITPTVDLDHHSYFSIMGYSRANEMLVSDMSTDTLSVIKHGSATQANAIEPEN